MGHISRRTQPGHTPPTSKSSGTEQPAPGEVPKAPTAKQPLSQADFVNAELAKYKDLSQEQQAAEKTVLEVVFQRADKDKSGKVDLSEFGALVDGLKTQMPSAPTTPGDVRRQAETLMYSPEHKQEAFRLIERDAYDANVSLDPVTRAKTLHQIEANKPMEQSFLSKLSRAQQEGYQRLAEQTQNDPLARLSLQMLLVEGKFSLNDKHYLLETLDHMITQPLAQGIDRSALVSDLVQEIALPTCIAQHNRGTCTMSATQIMLASTQPAEYARLVSGLATPGGGIMLNDGSTLKRLPGTQNPDDSGRTISARLFQCAAMDYANGKQFYRNTKKAGGLGKEEVETALEGILGHNTDSYKAHDGNRADLMQLIAESLKHGPVITGLEWGVGADGQKHEFHEIVLNKMTADRVYYTNPWGKEESMDRQTFMQKLDSVNFTEAISKPEEAWTATKDLFKRIGSWID